MTLDILCRWQLNQFSSPAFLNWQLQQISLTHPRIRGSLIKALGAFYSHCSPRSRSTQTSNLCLAWEQTWHGTGNEMAFGAWSDGMVWEDILRCLRTTGVCGSAGGGGENIDRNYCLAIVIDRPGQVFVGRDRYRLNGIHGMAEPLFKQIRTMYVLYLFPHWNGRLKKGVRTY